MLEEALQTVTADDIMQDCIVTIDGLSYSTPLTVIENTNSDRVFWAVYRGHKAASPQLSPFIDTQRKWPETTTLTLDFQRGWLVQVTPGEEEIPPLPWMISAAKFDGGIDACIAYWRGHSLLYSRYNTLPYSRTYAAPEWWREAA
jgi:hypothetical protein